MTQEKTKSVEVSVTLTENQLCALESLLAEGIDAVKERFASESDYTAQDNAAMRSEVVNGNDAINRLREALNRTQNDRPVTYEQRYLQGAPNTCPACLSQDDIEGDCIEVVGNRAHQDVGCNACGEAWRDEYTLTGLVRALSFNPKDPVPVEVNTHPSFSTTK